MHRANEVRPLMDGLGKLAESLHLAVLVVRHLAKASTSKAMYRGMGSIDFTAQARSVLLAGVDPADDTRRALAHLKSSCAPLGVAQGYALRRGEGEDFTWTGPTELTAQDLFAPEADREERGKLEEARDWLADYLRREGPGGASEVQRAAKAEGISERTLRRAKDGLGIKPRKLAERWVWDSPQVEHYSAMADEQDP